MDVEDSSDCNGSTYSSIQSNTPPNDTFKILIATDIHLGVHEKDPIRADDSFNTFEEILDTAKKRDVDFVLLGGDLFHDSKPSQACYVKAISLIRAFTMGGKPISIAFVSDKDVFQNSVIEDVNYQDPNQNVSYPIFSIHGNHDDPSGFGRTSALDVLSATGQLNYFGVCKDLTNIKLKPLLLKKGRSKLAIYGISHIRDERLSRLMAAGSVKYELPPNPDAWFKILVLHQNRVSRTGTKHIEDKWIPDFIDVVIWGHEHECLITPQKSLEPGKDFYIIQPGSPVATSLCEAEAVEKKIGVLNVCAKQFCLDEIKLQTVRPFIFHTETTSNWNFAAKRHPAKEFEDLARRFVKTRLMPKAEAMLTGHPKQPTLPLIRLRLELEDNSHQFNQIRFGQQHFNNTVANPGDMVTFKLAFMNRAQRKDNALIDAADLEDLLDTAGMKAEALAPEYFENEGNQKKKLKVLGIVGMCEAVTCFIEKDDKSAINAMINHQVQKTLEFLKEQNDLTSEKNVIHSLIDRFKEQRSYATQEEEIESARRYLESDLRLDTTDVLLDVKGLKAMSEEVKQALKAGKTLVDDMDDFPAFETTTTRGRGRGRGRGSRGASKAASSRASTASRASNVSRVTNETRAFEHTISDEDDSDLETTTTSRGRGRGGRTSSAFKASGRTSSASNSNGNRTMMDFVSRKAPPNTSQSSRSNPFDDLPSASPRKKAKIMYADDDSD